MRTRTRARTLCLLRCLAVSQRIILLLLEEFRNVEGRLGVPSIVEVGVNMVRAAIVGSIARDR